MRRPIAARPIQPLPQAVMAQFFQQSPDLSLLVDAEGWILSANDAFLALAPSSGPGTNFLDAHAGASRARLQIALLSPKAGQTVVGELRSPGAFHAGRRLGYRIFPLAHGVLGVTGREARRKVSRLTPETGGGVSARGARLPSTVDPLTGLGTREGFPNLLADAWNDAVQQDAPLSCVVLRVEGLERVMREGGREVADALRKAMVGRLKTLLREHDTLADYGEDRYVFLAFGCVEELARDIGQKVAREIAMTRFVVCGGIHRLAVRIGCGTRSAKDAPAESILLAATGEVERAR